MGAGVLSPSLPSRSLPIAAGEGGGRAAGARVLRQDPVECVFEFICSSNNHISRIHGMVERLCRDFGSPLSLTDGAALRDIPPLSPSSEHGRPSVFYPPHLCVCCFSSDLLSSDSVRTVTQN